MRVVVGWDRDESLRGGVSCSCFVHVQEDCPIASDSNRNVMS